jgi:hypothetical protein
MIFTNRMSKFMNPQFISFVKECVANNDEEVALQTESILRSFELADGSNESEKYGLDNM